MGAMSRTVAVVDVQFDAAQAFRSMLEVLNGRTRCRWQLVDSVDDANVIVTAFTHGRSLLSSWQKRDKRIVAIVETCDLRPETQYVLTHPFRVMQVLSILDEIADESAQAGGRPDAEVRHQVVDPLAAWDFARSVRALAASTPQWDWYRAQARDGRDVLVSGNLRSYACHASMIQSLRAGSLVLGSLEPATAQKVPQRQERRPIGELLWHNAYAAGATLAPWLRADAAFRVRHWPDFGVIPPTRARLQLVAALSGRSCTRNELARLTGAPRGEIDRVLSALSLCGFLHPDDSAVRDAHGGGVASSRPGTMIRALIGGLRKRLHLGG